MFFFIVITATRRLKRHTPCKTNRQKNGQETVLLSFRGILGGHKADPPRLPPQERLQNTDLLPLESTALFQLTAKQFYCFTAPIAWLTNNRAIKSRHKKRVFCSSVLTALTRLQNTDLLPLKKLSTAYPQVIHIVIHINKRHKHKENKGIQRQFHFSTLPTTTTNKRKI